PHTNMAKASLNMLTRTVAKSLSRDGVFVNSVDPGWVSYQVPAVVNQERFAPPLDAEDAAARILDPIFDGTNPSKTPQYGQLFKDYRSVPW
ncbi:MAG: SDR family oxidoreductase, partial [Planctomycetaceae bacterium]|nr:SDR family oxidoreductase [Planctomycetaceae bacterium]